MELDVLRGTRHDRTDLVVNPDAPFRSGVTARELDIEVVIEAASKGTFQFHLAGLEATYDASNATLHAFGRMADLRPIDGRLEFRILLDRTSVEIFAQGGLVVMSGFAPMDFDSEPLVITSQAGAHPIRTLSVWEMRSMWE